MAHFQKERVEAVEKAMHVAAEKEQQIAMLTTDTNDKASQIAVLMAENRLLAQERNDWMQHAAAAISLGRPIMGIPVDKCCDGVHDA